MASYSFNDMGGIEIDFGGVKPSAEIRNKMKAVKYRWDPTKMIWWAYKNDDTVAVAEDICGKVSATAPAETPSPVESVTRTTTRRVRKTPPKDYALKVKIKDIISADKAQLEAWGKGA